jgi:microcystin-dependent protein
VAGEIITPNMSLPLPGVGITSGPQYASDVNNCLTILDSHNHSSGSGVQITPSGLNINAPLTFNSNPITGVSSATFTQQTSLSTLNTLFVGADGNLYFNDGAGDPAIKITSGGAVNATSSGISSGTATASFSAGVLIVDAATNTPANIQAGSILLGNNVTGSSYLTLSPPSSMPGNYTITLPPTPASVAPMLMDSSGNISTNTALYNAFAPTGVLLPFGGSSAPAGWLLCNGAAVSRTTYATLFSIIGVTFGSGDGSTTFNVPNTGGVFIRGAGSQTIGGTPYSGSLGATQTDQFRSHSHNDAGHGHVDSGHLHGAGYYAGGQFLSSGSVNYVIQNNIAGSTGFSTNTGSANIQIGNANIQPTGGSETNPANLCLNYIIKT